MKVFEPESGSELAVYCHCSVEEADSVWKMLTAPKPVLIAIDEVDWDRDLSPWSAPKVFKNGNDFAGGAFAHLHELECHTIPTVEAGLKQKPEYRCIAGYSLAGLFALYACIESDCFDGFASVSGSMWFDGFADYLNENIDRVTVRAAYLSLGDTESKTKNQRMAKVGSCTEQVYELLKQQVCTTCFEWNTGGHFCESDRRLANGISKMCALINRQGD